MSIKLRFLLFVFIALCFNSISAFGTNPFLNSANQIVYCPLDGNPISKFTLCGDNDIRTFQVIDPTVQSVRWQLFNANSCALAVGNCSYQGITCSWNTVSTANTFSLNSEGDYRVILSYANTIDEIFHARSEKNTYSEAVSVTKDVSVNGGTDGEITIEAIGNGPFIYQ